MKFLASSTIVCMFVSVVVYFYFFICVCASHYISYEAWMSMLKLSHCSWRPSESRKTLLLGELEDKRKCRNEMGPRHLQVRLGNPPETKQLWPVLGWETS